MYAVIALATLLACAAALPTQDPRIDPDADWRVVGGSSASAGQFPFIISLRTAANSHSCGGSILTPNAVLTAAHCVTGSGSRSIVAGSNTLNSGGARHNVNRIQIHASYNANTLNNDIALVRTATSISYTNLIQPVSLNTAGTGGGVNCVLSGWGRTSFPGNIPNNLQFVNLQTVTNAVCQSRHSPNTIFAAQICTFTRAGQGACHGDSGGPLILTSNRAQIGIVSWGRPCAVGFPDVYARVSSYISWIQNAVNS